MADEYAKIEIVGLTASQGKAVMMALNDLNHRGTTIVMSEWAPDGADADLLRINVGGPSIAGFVSLVESEILSRLGRLPDVSTSVTREQSRVRTAADVGR